MEAGLVPVAPGRGRCEVVCFTSDHDGSFAELSEAGARRGRRLGRPDRRAVRSGRCGAGFPFENRGDEIGVTLSHPHGQIYGYPFVTPKTERMLDVARAYRPNTAGRCSVMCWPPNGSPARAWWLR